MKKYKKKPVIIEAMLFDGSFESAKKILQWNKKTKANINYNENCLLIHTLEGTMTANIGDYVIKGIQGEFYPCKPDIFHQTYELVDDEEREQEC